MTPQPRIGFVGLGIMGRPMARRLLNAGFELTVNSRTRSTADEVLQLGANWSESPREVAVQSDVLLSMLPDTPDVQTVYLGPGGVFEGIRRGCMAIDLSTVDIAASRELHSRFVAAGAAFLDAPVSGGEKGAIEGTLSIMVGGAADSFQAARSIFEILGRTVVHVGGPGAGQVAKACNQLIVAANIEAVAEALNLARSAGVDQSVVRDALMGGFAASRVLDLHGQRMIAGSFEPGFRSRLHSKDARIVQTLAASTRAPIPMFDVAANKLIELVSSGGGDLDHSALYTLLASGRRASHAAQEA